MLTYVELKDRPREFLAATGLKQNEFERLLPEFTKAYTDKYQPNKTYDGKPRKRQRGGGMKGRLEAMEDKLLFILVYEKTYQLQVMHGLQFGMSQAQANYWIHHLLPVLRDALARLKLTPERDATKLATSEQMMAAAPDVLIDGTERRIQRPQDAVKQGDNYSGKKKAHTNKNLLLVNQHTNRIVYLGPTSVGKTHDKKMADQEGLTYPPGATLTKDTGFQGYEPLGVITYQPKKSQKASR
jgi:DDE superfamily endonuclease/Helix-turn-helix of DDE superfamily endonuclease